ncbi:Tetratricopeptide repeat protein [compost metagenome]
MDGESCIKKAYAFIFDNDFEQAIYWFEQAIAAEPDNASYHYKCAVSYARSGKWLKAKEHAAIALELDPEHDDYHYQLQTIEAKLLLIEADALLAAQPPMLIEAAERMEQAARLDPLCFEAFYKMGVVYASLDRLENAWTNAKEAVRLDPSHSGAKRLFADLNRQRRMLRSRIYIRQRKRNR